MTTMTPSPQVDKESNPWESQRARFDFAAVSGYANCGALGSRQGVGPQTKGFNLFAHGPDLFRFGVRLHDYQHDFTSNLQV